MDTNYSMVVILWILSAMTLSECRRPRGRQKGTAASPSRAPTYDMCPPCEVSHCPVVTPETCTGSIVKDWCNCCPICIGGTGVILSTSAASITTSAIATSAPESEIKETDQSEACEKITCSKFQVCMLNIQGIPMCRCPTKFWCMKGERNPVCGQNDVTYKSKCFLKMAECESAENIAVKHKGKCFRSQKDRRIKLERQKQKELKTQQRAEKKKLKMEKINRKIKKDSRKDRKRRKQRRRTKNKPWAGQGDA